MSAQVQVLLWLPGPRDDLTVWLGVGKGAPSPPHSACTFLGLLIYAGRKRSHQM